MKILFIFLTTVMSVFFIHNSQDKTLKESIESGQLVYEDFCVNCHLPSGKGVPNVYPPLAKSDYLIENREASIRGIKYGLKGEIVVNGQAYRGYMAPLGLSDDEVADVMNYITNAWGNKNQTMVSISDVSKIKK